MSSIHALPTAKPSVKGASRVRDGGDSPARPQAPAFQDRLAHPAEKQRRVTWDGWQESRPPGRHPGRLALVPSGGDEPRNSTAVWPWKLQTNGKDKGHWDKTSSGPRDDPSRHSLGGALGRLPGTGSLSHLGPPSTHGIPREMETEAHRGDVTCRGHTASWKQG